jgi:chemotaxis response regulator CheB
MHRPFKVVIVDDSLTMRRWLNSVIAKDPRLNIVGMAGNAQEAREVIKATQPDVLTLDIEMPGMNGLEFLAHLMRLHPMPVVMLASSVQNGSVCAQQALDIGAVACVGRAVREHIQRRMRPFGTTRRTQWAGKSSVAGRSVHWRCGCDRNDAGELKRC